MYVREQDVHVVSRNSTTTDCTRTSRNAANPLAPTDSSSMDSGMGGGRVARCLSPSWWFWPGRGGRRGSSDCHSNALDLLSTDHI